MSSRTVEPETSEQAGSAVIQMTPDGLVLRLLLYEYDFAKSLCDVFERSDRDLEGIRQLLEGAEPSGWAEVDNVQVVIDSFEASCQLTVEEDSILKDHVSQLNKAIIGLEVGNFSRAIAVLSETAERCRELAAEYPDRAHHWRRVAIGNDVLVDELRKRQEESASESD